MDYNGHIPKDYGSGDDDGHEEDEVEEDEEDEVEEDEEDEVKVDKKDSGMFGKPIDLTISSPGDVESSDSESDSSFVVPDDVVEYTTSYEGE